jgi:hypothetical protein
MAGRVSKVEPLARLGDLNVTYGFSVEDEDGAPLLFLAFGRSRKLRLAAFKSKQSWEGLSHSSM